MCGRTATFIPDEELKNRYNPETADLSEYQPSYNESPGTQKPFVTENSPIRIDTAHWGFIPETKKDVEKWKKKSVINARAESLKEKDLFKDSWRRKRCLIPVNGFYEWKNDQPFYFSSPNQDIISLAGIYTEYQDNSYSFAIITRPARPFMEEIHDRQPVILKTEEETKYLKGRISHGRMKGREDKTTDFLEMQKHPVTKK